MVEQILVSNIQSVVKNFKEKYGPFSLFLLAFDEKMNYRPVIELIISASWLDNKSVKEGLELLLPDLKMALQDNFVNISRVALVNTKDKLVRDINQSIRVTDSKVELHSINLGGTTFDNVVILESNIPS